MKVQIQISWVGQSRNKLDTHRHQAAPCLHFVNVLDIGGSDVICNCNFISHHHHCSILLAYIFSHKIGIAVIIHSEQVKHKSIIFVQLHLTPKRHESHFTDWQHRNMAIVPTAFHHKPRLLSCPDGILLLSGCYLLPQLLAANSKLLFVRRSGQYHVPFNRNITNLGVSCYLHAISA